MSGKENVKVKVIHDDAILPQKGSTGAAGWDLSTVMDVHLNPGERKLVSTGICLEIPKKHYGRVASRSSLASQGVDVAGGVIGADFRGEVKVILANHSDQSKSFQTGDRIAQLVVEKISDLPLVEVTELSNTSRGGRGFGSSGPAVRRVTGQDVDLQGAEPHGHERREGQVHEGGSGGVPLWERMPTNLFFDPYTSRGGESMSVFVERLKGDELRDFAWLFTPEVLSMVCTTPVNGTPYECVLRFPQGVVTLKIHRHGGWRKNVFDSELSVPLASTGLSAAVVTIAWLEDGRMTLRSDFRKGSREPWHALSEAALVRLQHPRSRL